MRHGSSRFGEWGIVPYEKVLRKGSVDVEVPIGDFRVGRFSTDYEVIE